MGKASIVNLDIVGTWGYDTDNKDCPLCRKDLMAATQEDISKGTINNRISVGKCRDFYHKPCMEKYIQQGNISCPSCTVEWKEDTEVGSSIFIQESTKIPKDIFTPKKVEDIENQKEEPVPLKVAEKKAVVDSDSESE